MTTVCFFMQFNKMLCCLQAPNGKIHRYFLWRRLSASLLLLCCLLEVKLLDRKWVCFEEDECSCESDVRHRGREVTSHYRDLSLKWMTSSQDMSWNVMNLVSGMQLMPWPSSLPMHCSDSLRLAHPCFRKGTTLLPSWKKKGCNTKHHQETCG